MQQFAGLPLFRTDLHKSDGFRERERESADLCFQNRRAIAAVVRRDEDAETPECRQTCENARQSDVVREGEDAQRNSPLERAWWRRWESNPRATQPPQTPA